MTITISELTFNAIIGLLDFERVKEQKVIVDCVIDYRYEKTFLDYSTIAALIEQELKTRQFELIEEALLHLETVLFETFPQILILELKISKPDILRNCTVSVSNKRIFKEN
jgi:dihydroneopterin aldolase